MKVAFCIRDDFQSNHGGDVVQLLKTKEYLEKNHQIEISIITRADDLNESFDIAHIFNLSTISYSTSFVKKAVNLKIKIAISTIFWNYNYSAISGIAKHFKFFPDFFNTNILIVIVKVLSFIFNKPLIISSKTKKCMRYMIDNSDILLPNSQEEINELIKFIGIREENVIKKVHIIPNAADFQLSDKSIDNILERYSIPPNYVLQVGRIEFIKNQVQTIKALENHPDIPIVFIGREKDIQYAAFVKQEASKRTNVYFIPEIPHSEVQFFYKKALVHVLPSLRESPGLVSLEALSNNCKIVVSNSKFCPSDTYFKDIASIANPLSKNDLKNKIFREIGTPRNFDVIRKKIEKCFSWEKAAFETFTAYKNLVSVEKQ